MPKYFLQKIKHKKNLVNIINNIAWLFFDKALRIGVGLIVGVWMARYLGPEQFGILNYAIAFVGLFGAFSALGFDGVIVRNIVRQPSRYNIILGSSLILQLIASIFTVFLILLILTLVHENDEILKIVVTIIGLSLIFKSSVIIKYWFESQVESRFSVWIESSVFILVSVVKIFMIVNQVELVYFAWAILFEAVLVSVGLFYIYIKVENKLLFWKFEFTCAKKLISDSWPLLISSIAIVVYMQIDQIMLGQMLGNESVGIYSVAVRLSEAWYFIPIIITSTLYPAILKFKDNSAALYEKRFQQLYSFLFFSAIAIALPLTFLSEYIIYVLFGEEYFGAVDVLKIHIWASVFVFLGVASGRWLVSENLQIYSTINTLLGAVVNVLLNLILIKKYGVDGAAWATLISYFIAAYLSLVFYKKTRKNFINISKSMYYIIPILKGKFS